MIHPGENEHLGTHVAADAERFKTVFKRLRDVEDGQDRLQARVLRWLVAVVLLLLSALVAVVFHAPAA